MISSSFKIADYPFDCYFVAMFRVNGEARTLMCCKLNVRSRRRSKVVELTDNGTIVEIVLAGFSVNILMQGDISWGVMCR